MERKMCPVIGYLSLMSFDLSLVNTCLLNKEEYLSTLKVDSIVAR